MAPKVRKVEIGDTRERSIHSRPKAGQKCTSTVVLTPSLSQVLQYLWRSQNIHMKRWVYNIQCYQEGCIHHTLYRQGCIQHSAYLEGAYTRYNLPSLAPRKRSGEEAKSQEVGWQL